MKRLSFPPPLPTELLSLPNCILAPWEHFICSSITEEVSRRRIAWQETSFGRQGDLAYWKPGCEGAGFSLWNVCCHPAITPREGGLRDFFLIGQSGEKVISLHRHRFVSIKCGREWLVMALMFILYILVHHQSKLQQMVKWGLNCPAPFGEIYFCWTNFTAKGDYWGKGQMCSQTDSKWCVDSLGQS